MSHTLTHSHFLYCLGVMCNKWFWARPLKTDYRLWTMNHRVQRLSTVNFIFRHSMGIKDFLRHVQVPLSFFSTASDSFLHFHFLQKNCLVELVSILFAPNTYMHTCTHARTHTSSIASVADSPGTVWLRTRHCLVWAPVQGDNGGGTVAAACR